MTRASRRQERLRARYDATFADPVFAAFTRRSGYCNFGYWEPATVDAAEASDNLVDRLLAAVSVRGGPVLDVACGQGGTTKRLASRLGAGQVVGVNFARSQLRAARAIAPGLPFVCMDAASLGFDAGVFELVFCLEAAGQFETRRRFLGEAHRVLRPGGCLLASDAITRLRGGIVSPANQVRSIREYEDLLRSTGFTGIQLEDVRSRTWQVFRRRYARFVARWRGRLSILRRNPLRTARDLWRFLVTEALLRHYVLIVARKPADGQVGSHQVVREHEPIHSR
jgi:SAM-dependent methyltransferase